jgi:hypothetical protein
MILIAFLGLFINGFLPIRNIPNDLKVMNLKGIVKSVIDTIYYADSNSPWGVRYLEYDKKFDKKSYFFNRAGNIVQETEFGIDNVIINGKLPLRDTVHYIEYSYDNKGNRTQKRMFTKNIRLYWKELYNYNEDGHINEVISVNYKGDVYSRKKYKYQNTRIIIVSYITEKINDSNTLISKFNKIRNLSKQYSYNANGQLTGIVVLKYNEKDLKSEFKSYDYNRNIDYRWKYKYDNKGNRIEVFVYNKNYTSGWVYKYENFDKFGNWTKRTEFIKNYVNDKPGIITERSIEYY